LVVIQATSADPRLVLDGEEIGAGIIALKSHGALQGWRHRCGQYVFGTNASMVLGTTRPKSSVLSVSMLTGRAACPHSRGHGHMGGGGHQIAGNPPTTDRSAVGAWRPGVKLRF
jgi:hypothetical protein